MRRGDTSRKPKAAWIRSLIPSTPSCTIRQSIGVTVSFRPSPKIPLQLTHQLYPMSPLPCPTYPATRDIEKTLRRRMLHRQNVLVATKKNLLRSPSLVEDAPPRLFLVRYTTYVPGRNPNELAVCISTSDLTLWSQNHPGKRTGQTCICPQQARSLRNAN